MTTLAWGQFEKAPAFPGAEGFGRYVTGGRGGRVLHVTKLADDNSEGTFRWACNQAGARTIVFDVDGTIFLTSELRLRNADVSILGQTAPGDGICVADFPFVISAKNVILRYLRFRLGNRQVAHHEGDGLGGMDQENIIVDHCSVSWSVDECLSVYGSKNISVQWCMVDQSMVNSGHSKGAHGYGGNWGGSGASYHHNLLAHHTSRCPRLGPRPGTQCDERMDLRNCVMYNYGKLGCYGGEGMNVNIVNNYYKPGPATLRCAPGYQKRIAAIGIRTTDYTKHGTAQANDWDKMWHVWGTLYVKGNYNSAHADVTADNYKYGIYDQIDAKKNDGLYSTPELQAEVQKQITRTAAVPFGFVTTHTAATAYDRVLSYAGASLRRDSHDRDIVADVSTGTAKYTGDGLDTGFINTQDDAGGWPTLAAGPAPLDTDRDGMPDTWETAHGLNPNGADDANLYSLDSKGFYTNVEVYCNSLVEEQVKAQNAGAVDGEEGAYTEWFPDMKPQTQGGTEQTVEETTQLYVWPDCDGANSITFDDGATLAITGNTSKNLGAGSWITYKEQKVKSIKVSNGAQNTFTAPVGKFIKSVTFVSYVNIDSENRTPYWREVGGVDYCDVAVGADGKKTYTPNAQTVVHKSYKDGEHPDIVSFTIGGKPSFTFTNAGEQICYVMDVTYGAPSATGITGVVSREPLSDDTYNIQGQRVAPDKRGIVIRQGRKFVNR